MVRALPSGEDVFAGRAMDVPTASPRQLASRRTSALIAISQ